MSSEFRYDFKKVLGTQNRLTHGLPSTHCFLRFNLIKEMFNIVFYTHTHTNMHLTINMASNIPKPNIHLSYLSTKPSIHLSWHLIQGNNKSRQKYAWQNMFILIIKYIPNACSCECMTYLPYLIASQHLCIINGHMNACSWHQNKKRKENPNLARQKKTNNSNGGIET